MEKEKDSKMHTVTVKGDINFETQVTSDIARQIVMLAVGGATSTQAVPPAIPGYSSASAPSQSQLSLATKQIQQPSAAASTETSANDKHEVVETTQREKGISEYFREVGPPRNPDKIVTIGRYLELYQDQETFTRDDIEKWFKAARERVPSNIPRDISFAIRAGLLTEDPDNPGHYQLLRPGQDIVDDNFPDEAVDKTRRAWN